MKPFKQKLNQTERKMYEFIESLINQENAVFSILEFRDKGRVMSIKIRRVCNVNSPRKFDTPQIDVKEQTGSLKNRMSVLKDNSDGSDTNYLETRNTNGEDKKQEKEAKSVENRHPVGKCFMCVNEFCNSDYNKGKCCDGINIRDDCPYKNGGSFAMAVYDKKNESKGDYVRLNDVLGLFKNRKQTKTRLNQREHIIQHLNKLPKIRK